MKYETSKRQVVSEKRAVKHVASVGHRSIYQTLQVEKPTLWDENDHPASVLYYAVHRDLQLAYKGTLWVIADGIDARSCGFFLKWAATPTAQLRPRGLWSWSMHPCAEYRRLKQMKQYGSHRHPDDPQPSQ